MTTRDKAAHLYRRFGLGAVPTDLDLAEKKGIDAAVRKLIEFDQPTFPGTKSAVSPQEFVWHDKGEADLGMYRYRCWWMYRMLTTDQPLREKLAVFWHNHFAVADNKVEDGPMMLDYLQILRTQGAGKFEDLLIAMAKNPAMMKYLDLDRNLRGAPNENFAREVMELFTLGIGNYTETDVKEVARSLTGWGYMNIFWELPGEAKDKIKDSIAKKRPFSSFTFSPGMHDEEAKTVLGKTANYSGEDVLRVLARHPVTARRISKKLWEYFAYEDPEPAVLDRLQARFLATKGDIRQVLYAIAKSPEFWGARSVRGLVKSPLDLCVPVARQMGAGLALAELRSAGATPLDPIPQKIMDVSGTVTYLMDRQGMALLNPPNVSGWRWGTAWASPSMMLERYKYRGVLWWGAKGPDSGPKTLQAAVQARKPKDSSAITQAFLESVDATLTPDSTRLVQQVFEKYGGIKVLTDLNAFAGAADHAMGLVMASPEFQMA